MRMYFGVTLVVELKEGGRLAWEDGARFVANEDMGCVERVSNADIVQHVQDVLADVTKHDDTITWRVVDVIEQDGTTGAAAAANERA